MRLMRFHLAVWLVGSVHAQPAEINVQLALHVPQATCALAVQEPVDFGSVTGQDDTISLFPDHSDERGQTPGQFIVTGQYASHYMVSIEFPRQITGPGTPLAYEGQWGQARTAEEPFSAITGKALHIPADGPVERHFLVGGIVRGLSIQTKPGLYVGQISITTTCN